MLISRLNRVLLTASRIPYANSYGKLIDHAGLIYNDTLLGGSIEYGMGVTRTLSRTTDITTSTALLETSLTTTDTFVSNSNDGGSAMSCADYTYNVGGSFDPSNDVVTITYTALNALLVNSGTQTVKGSSDADAIYVAVQGIASLNSISVPTDGDSPVIAVLGGRFSASAQIVVTAPATPYLQYTGIQANATRIGGAVPNVCYGGNFQGVGGVLSYGVYAAGQSGTTNIGVFGQGTTAAFQAAGHYLPLTNNTYDVGSSALRIRKVWAVAADFSGAVTVAGTLQSTAGRKINRTAVSDTNYTILSTDEIVAYTALTAARTATLPNATGNANQTFTIKDESGSAGTFNLTIATSGGNIDGAATYVMKIPYQSVTVYSNGTNYFIT